MKLTQVVFEPKAEIEFTRADLRILFELSERHYDGVCRSLSERGGMLYGMRNEFRFCSTANKKLLIVTRTLANREVQLLCKLCEIASYWLGSRPVDVRKRKHGMTLGHELYVVLREMSAEFEHTKVVVK